MQNLLGDLIIRIQNGQQARLGAITLHSATPKSLVRLLEILREEGYIIGFQEHYNKKFKHIQLKVFLKYNTMGMPAIRKIFQVSKPSKRIYISTLTI